MASMHITRSRLTSLAAVLALTLTATACGADKEAGGTISKDCKPKWQFDTIHEGVLTVVAVNNPPTIQIDPDTNKAEGVDADVLPKFAKVNCLDIKWLPLSGAAGVAAMTEGKGDIGSGGWGITEERGKVIGQMHTPTFWNGASVLSKKPIDTMDGLKGSTVGVEGGSLYQEPVTKFLGKDDVRVYQSVDAEIADLKAGRIDAVVSQAIQTRYQAEKRDMLNDFHFAVLKPDQRFPALTELHGSNYPYTKSNKALGSAIEEFVAEMKKSGEFQKILRAHGFDDVNINGA
jgi:polar amino acid transport system substrate-binding protein